MTEKNPGMPEILGAIRRIIAEDSEDFVVAAREQRLDEGKEPNSALAKGARESERDAPDGFGTVELEKNAGNAEDTNTADSDMNGENHADEEGLLSANVETEVVRAMGDLRKRVAVHRGRGTSLDDLVREMLRPILRQWLDEHLPGIIERLVREELRRITRDIER